MKTIKYTVKRTTSVYTLQVFTKEEFLETDLKIMNDGKGYVFLLFTTDKEDSIENVEVLGSTVSKEKLIEQLIQANNTHVAYIDYNGWIAKPVIDENLILEFKPTAIWFLDGNIKLAYSPIRF